MLLNNLMLFHNQKAIKKIKEYKKCKTTKFLAYGLNDSKGNRYLPEMPLLKYCQKHFKSGEFKNNKCTFILPFSINRVRNKNVFYTGFSFLTIFS